MRKIAGMIALIFVLQPALFGECVDTKIWDSVLKANVDTNGYVDYDSIRINKGGDILEFISFMEDADISNCSETEKLAFWINAYNAHSIRLVLARPQMQSISEDFKLFGEKFKIAKQKLSLNEIEHRVLRSSERNGGPIHGVSLSKLDPRIHFALTCGAVDCPKLKNRTYESARLDEQLQEAALSYANDPKYVRIEDGRLVLSKFMKWYAGDFESIGGVPTYLAGLTSLSNRGDEQEIDEKLMQDFPDQVDFRFDWTVNSKQNAPK